MIIQKNKGLTLVEILVSITVLMIIGTISLVSFSLVFNSTNGQNDISHILSSLSKARNQSMFSKDGDTYGVHFSPSVVDLYQGNSYSEAIHHDIYSVSPSFIITADHNDIHFERFTGVPSATTSITLNPKTAYNTKSHTIILYQTGIAEIQP